MEKDLKELLKKIRELREKMNKVVEDKDDLLDKDVINISKTMDKLLNQFDGISDKDEDDSLN